MSTIRPTPLLASTILASVFRIGSAGTGEDGAGSSGIRNGLLTLHARVCEIIG